MLGRSFPVTAGQDGDERLSTWANDYNILDYIIIQAELHKTTLDISLVSHRQWLKSSNIGNKNELSCAKLRSSLMRCI